MYLFKNYPHNLSRNSAEDFSRIHPLVPLYGYLKRFPRGSLGIPPRFPLSIATGISFVIASHIYLVIYSEISAEIFIDMIAGNSLGIHDRISQAIFAGSHSKN